MNNFQEMLIIFGAKYLIFFALAIFCIYFLLSNGEAKKKILIFSIIALPLSYLVAKISSYFYYDARPFVVGNFAPLIPHSSDNGFPSDHTLLAGAVAVVSLYFNKKVGAILFILAMLVGFSRVLAGVHHLTDIVGSLLIVSAVSLVTYKFLLPRVLKILK